MSCLRPIPDIRRSKLDFKTNICIFLGYVKNSNACRFLDLGTNSIIKARDAEFFEDKFIKDKDLSLKAVTENAKKSITPAESISSEAEGVDTEEETPKVTEQPSMLF